MSLGGGAVPVDICYDHVHKPIDIVLCTEPAYGFSRGSDFWGGNPPFAANQTMLDAFLTYRTEMMGAHVRFNDLDADTREAVLPYLLSGPLTPSSVLARLAALIPPAVLAEDLTTLARWLVRSDRPSLALAAQRARLDLAGSPPITAQEFQDAVLAPSLGLTRQSPVLGKSCKLHSHGTNTLETGDGC